MVFFGDLYVVISGDGLGVDYVGNIEVVFEFKCFNLDNKRIMGVYYNFLNYYIIQVFSQMLVKKCYCLVYLSFILEFVMFFEGLFDVDIWKEVWKIVEDLYGKLIGK